VTLARAESVCSGAGCVHLPPPASTLNPRWHLRKKTCGGHYELLSHHLFSYRYLA
jgi:hypothetical protein